MATDLQQLDLFGNDMSSHVHIAAPKSIKSNKQAKPIIKPVPVTSYAAPIVNQVAEDDLPLVSISAQHLNTSATSQKRGRKSFASMDAEMGKVNIPSAEILEKKIILPYWRSGPLV